MAITNCLKRLYGYYSKVLNDGGLLGGGLACSSSVFTALFVASQSKIKRL